MPWYLFPGLPKPTISQGVYSTLAPLFVSATEQRTENLVLAEGFVKYRGQ